MKKAPPFLVVGLLSCVAATVAAPAQGPASHPSELILTTTPYELPVAERHRLPSGPIVYLVADPTLPLVELAVALRVGSFMEDKESTGLAELTAALMRRGGAGERDADELDEGIDGLGAELDAHSGNTRAGLSLTVPSWELEAALDLVFDVLARPRWQQDRLAALRSNLTESMGRRNQDPLAILQREWGWLLFGDFHGTRMITPATLAKIDQEAIVGFWADHWRPDSLIIAVSGDVRGKELLTALEDRVAAWRKTRAAHPPAVTPWPPPGPPGGSPPGLYLAASDSPQAKVLIGHPLDGELSWESSERAAVEMLQEILGGSGAISRLNGRLRSARGLVYRTWANIEPGPDQPGYLRVFLETSPARVPRAIAMAIEELERLRDELVHPRELEIVRRTLINRIPKLFDTPEKIAGRYSENELVGRRGDYWERHLEHLRAVSREDVRTAARKVLRLAELRYLVVGPVDPTTGGDGSLQAVTGHPAISLPRRDPSTLEPLRGAAPGENRGGN